MNNDKVTTEDLFATWNKELGYNKAVLISCCYPIMQVISMTEEDAEAEVDAIGYFI
jgi:hypothetical protein